MVNVISSCECINYADGHDYLRFVQCELASNTENK
jgi:hypothetical protein